MRKSLETICGSVYEAVKMRRHEMSKILSTSALSHFKAATEDIKVYNYDQAYKSNCENMIGVLQVPVGVINNFKINNKLYNIPFATTEGTLIASVSRGVKALNHQGVSTIVRNNGITRGLLVEFDSMSQAQDAIEHITINYDSIKNEFEKNSRFTKLQSITPIQLGKQLHLKFRATTGNGMGMNMISKGVFQVWNSVLSNYSGIKYITISGNTCTDKKSNSMNWITGRGYEVHTEANISANVLRDVLRLTAKDLVDINIKKNYQGSALAGTIGGNNSHAANIVGGIFLSTGQDIAQIGTSSMCMLNIEEKDEGLYVSLRMPCVELATIGGGTSLTPQKHYIRMMDIEDASELASVIGGCVIAGELSLLTALVQNQLVSAHMSLNRK